MSCAVFELIDPGVGASFQDQGRWGWRRLGVPVSGAMDDHAAQWANRLLDNPPDAPVLELLLHGARVRALEDVAICVTGADTSPVPMWRIVTVAAGELLEFRPSQRGLWTYLAVESGFAAESILGSCSAYHRGGLGDRLHSGVQFNKNATRPLALPSSIAGRMVHPDELRSYDSPPPIRVWPGPQHHLFSPEDRDLFFAQHWTVSARSDRVGYRLTGQPFATPARQILSEPMRVGTIQIPENGTPIVIMRDGPTVGGYPKFGMIHPPDLCWLAQCRPGQRVQFTLWT